MVNFYVKMKMTQHIQKLSNFLHFYIYNYRAKRFYKEGDETKDLRNL